MDPAPRTARKPHPEFTAVFRGRELTRKTRRIPSGIAEIDGLLQGGIPYGRISELTGPRGCGKTSVAAAFMASSSAGGGTVAIVDSTFAFDPAAMAAAGVALSKVLWVHAARGAGGTDYVHQSADYTPSIQWDHARGNGGAALAHGRRHPLKEPLRATELILEAGGFTLLAVDLDAPATPRTMLSESTALRLALMAERSGTALLIIAPRALCGTFTALNLAMGASSPCFTSMHPDMGAGRVRSARLLFDGLRLEGVVRRNKLGASGMRARWTAAVDHETTFATRYYVQPAGTLSVETPSRAAAGGSA